MAPSYDERSECTTLDGDTFGRRIVVVICFMFADTIGFVKTYAGLTPDLRVLIGQLRET